MTTKALVTVFTGLLAIGLALPASASEKGRWTEIEAPPSFVDFQGKTRFPACSSGPVPTGGLPQPADGEFSFFVKPGNPERLAIFFDGGGACWDGLTCVGAPLAGQGLYAQTVSETVEGLSELNGLGDLANRENPVRNYTQVFIPYCTGDLHAGAADTTYVAPTPLGPLPWTIRHRGADNVAYVLDWLDENLDDVNRGGQKKRKGERRGLGKGKSPNRLYLSGASAGGYGVIYHTPGIMKRYPDAKEVRVLVDAANGVINQDFYDRALAPSGGWNVWENLAPELAPAFGSGSETLSALSLISLGAAYPDARFGQYTTAFDGTQIAFFNVARNLLDPSKWFDPLELQTAAFLWATKAATDMFVVASATPNYRLYRAAGGDHTIVGSDKTYTEDTAGGVRFIDWFRDMIRNKSSDGGDWQNLDCGADCF